MTENEIYEMDVKKKKMHSHSASSDAQNINKVLHYSKSKERQSGAARQKETGKEANIYLYL